MSRTTGSGAYVIKEDEQCFHLLHTDNSVELVNRRAFEYKKDYLFFRNSEALAYPIHEIANSITMCSDPTGNRLPAYHLGAGISNQKKTFTWVAPVRIYILKHAMMNFRIYSNFYCTKELRNKTKKLDIIKSSCKYCIIYF